MPHQPRTMKVKSADTESGFIVINEEDYDKEVHQKYADRKAGKAKDGEEGGDEHGTQIKVIADTNEGFSFVDEEDFDPEIHQEYSEPATGNIRVPSITGSQVVLSPQLSNPGHGDEDVYLGPDTRGDPIRRRFRAATPSEQKAKQAAQEATADERVKKAKSKLGKSKQEADEEVDTASRKSATPNKPHAYGRN